MRGDGRVFHKNAVKKASGKLPSEKVSVPKQSPYEEWRFLYLQECLRLWHLRKGPERWFHGQQTYSGGVWRDSVRSCGFNTVNN